MAKAKDIPHFSSEELKERIAVRYPAPAYATLFELRDATGAGAARSADAVAFGTWPSRGLAIIGFEVKSYRGDWLNELKNPAKAESIAQFCDQWYLVASEAVAKLEEIPQGWGWLAPVGPGLREIKAPILPADHKPKEITRRLLMSIVRNISNEYTPNWQLDKKVDAKAEEKIKWQRSSLDEELKKYKKLEEDVKTFEEASGLQIKEHWRYPVKELGRVISAIYGGDRDEQLRRARQRLDKAKEMVDALEALNIVDLDKVRSGIEEEESGEKIKFVKEVKI